MKVTQALEVDLVNIDRSFDIRFSDSLLEVSQSIALGRTCTRDARRVNVDQTASHDNMNQCSLFSSFSHNTNLCRFFWISMSCTACIVCLSRFVSVALVK